MTDRELLELAAKAAGIEIGEWDEQMQVFDASKVDGIPIWNALTSDRDALRLAVKLGFGMSTGGVATVVHHYGEPCRRRFEEPHCKDADAATRRAIVRAAAEIGRAMG